MERAQQGGLWARMTAVVAAFFHKMKLETAREVSAATRASGWSYAPRSSGDVKRGRAARRARNVKRAKVSAKQRTRRGRRAA